MEDADWYPLWIFDGGEATSTVHVLQGCFWLEQCDLVDVGFVDTYGMATGVVGYADVSYG